MSRFIPTTQPSPPPTPTGTNLKRTAAKTSLVSGLALTAAGGGLVTLILWGFSWLGAGGVAVGGAVWAMAQLAKKGLSQNQSPQDDHTALVQFKQTMTRCRYLEHVEKYGEHAAAQFESLMARRRQVSDLLDQKFRPGELTHGRYAMIAEQTFFSMCDNLSEIATALQTVDAIDPVSIEPHLRELEAAGGSAPRHQQERTSLQERLTLRRTQLEQIAARLGTNEETLTQMDRLTTALSALRDQSSHAELDLESSLEELKRLTTRVDQYKRH